MADQWRGDALSLLGTPGVVTPNLDALAARSVTFTNHWCQASPCGPSRRSLLTGTTLPTHGQWTNDGPGPASLISLAQAVWEAGVTPLLIGYTDTPTSWPPPNQPPAAETLYDPAFEMVRPFDWQLGFPHYRAELAARGYGPLGEGLMDIYPPAGPPTDEGLAPSRIAAADSDVAWLTDGAIETITGLGRPGPPPDPWLLHVNWLRPHPPLVPPAPYHRLVDPDEVAPPLRPLSLEAQAEVHPFYALAVRRRSLREYLQRRQRIEAVTEREERHIRAAYFGLCAEVDHHLGRLLDALRASGQADDTLIVFTSDHGDALGDHWLYGRRGPVDGHFRVPCLIHDPRPEADGTRGTTVDAFTANIDLMPTILDALGRATPPSAEGTSLAPFLTPSPTSAATLRSWRSHITYAMDWTDHVRPGPDQDRAGTGPHRFTAVRTEGHLHVSFSTFDPLFFDLEADPEATVNRAGDPALAGVEQELAARSLAGRPDDA